MNDIWLLIALSLDWQPINTGKELEERIVVANSILETDATESEQKILMRLAFTESRYSYRVAKCAKGTVENTVKGSRGTFQVIPRNKEEWNSVCKIGPAAVVALKHVRESFEACARLPYRERLAVYAAGKCSSKKGRLLSRGRVLESE